MKKKIVLTTCMFLVALLGMGQIGEFKNNELIGKSQIEKRFEGVIQAKKKRTTQ